MLGKTIVDGLGLIDVKFDPSLYQILTPIGESKKARELTKQEIVL
jgi:hypothetical protein